MKFYIAIFFLTLLCVVSGAHAATRTWTGGGNDNRMSNPANWAENAAPTPGDDLIFPGPSAQYTVSNDVLIGGPPQQSFNSITLQGGNYVFIGNALNVNGITATGGSHDFSYDTGPAHVLNGTLLTAQGAIVSISVYQRNSVVTIDGAGLANIRITGSSSNGPFIKNGTGTMNFRYTGAGRVSRLVVNGGRVFGQGGTNLDSLEVTGGELHGFFSGVGVATITGEASDVATWLSPNSLRINNGARYSPTSCQVPSNALIVDISNAFFDPSFQSCAAGVILISNHGSAPITGSFVNYPEGSLISVGAQRLRVTYKGGDGNDMQLLPYNTAHADATGDNKADISVFRPSNGTWYFRNGEGYMAVLWGMFGDLIAPADYDGDGKSDIAVFRPSTGVWYVMQSATGSPMIMQWGQEGDIPSPGDYDGDGKADIAVFRPSTGTWWISQSALGTWAVNFGQAGDVPVAGDYDGDGRTDPSVFRPENGSWYMMRSQAGTYVEAFGTASDTPVPADYDGDGKTDIAVYRPSIGLWFRHLSSTSSYLVSALGDASDIPVPADFDGDNRADLGVFQTYTGTWRIELSAGGNSETKFGTIEDVPVESAFVRGQPSGWISRPGTR